MRRSISRVLADRAREAPHDVVVVDADGALTAADLDEAATRLAKHLRREGVRVDDLITVTLPNCRAFVIACAAIWKAGATPQPASPNLTDDEWRHLEQVVRPTAVFGRRMSADVLFVETVDVPGSSDDLPELTASSWKAPATSGSTGRPKVVKAAAPALVDPTRPVAEFLPLTGTQLVTGPLTHSATFTYAFRGLFTGHTLVLHPRFDERCWLEAVERHQVTWTLLVPTMMHRLLRLPVAERDPRRLRSLESVLHLGAPCAPAVKREFLEWMGPERVLELYAGSESNGLTLIRGDDWLTHPGSVGRPIGGTTVEIRGGDGTVGEVWLRRGEQATYSYLGADSRRDDHGWDTLGDLGRLDEDGYLYLLDRADDVINRGGEKICPVEIEQVLEQHPGVRSAVAFGLPDPDLGQRIGAVVDVADHPVTAAELRTWVRPRLGPRTPADLRIVHTPVRNDAGKTSRRRWSSADDHAAVVAGTPTSGDVPDGSGTTTA